jgi:hypothetical protein
VSEGDTHFGPIHLPGKQSDLIKDICERAGGSGGCWDLVVWNDQKRLVFVELLSDEEGQNPGFADAMAERLSCGRFANR